MTLLNTDDDDESAVWKAYHQHKQGRRAAHRLNSTTLLREHAVAFIQKNEGAHLIVSHNGKTVDFWPGTGKWIDRAGPKRRGVFPLLHHLGVVIKKPEPPA